MPEALATTKRKFHKLLDSRFGAPQVQPAPVPIQPSPSTNTLPEPATKRVRSDTSTSASLAASLHRRNLSAASIISAKSTTSARKVAQLDSTKKPPNFAPWSHDAFLARLKTFSPITLWGSKPEAVNEVAWTKRGWSCVDANTVGCKGGCGKRVVVNVEPIVRRRLAGAEEDEEEAEDEEDEEALEQALVERYRDLIVEGHAEGCLWRQAGCKDDIHRLPVVKSTIWQPELQARYLSLQKISHAFEGVALRPTDTHPSPERLFADLPPTLLAPTPSSTEPAVDAEPFSANPKALLISLCGWSGVTESQIELLTCSACFQRLGLWMYQKDYKRPRFSTSEDVAAEEPEAEEPQTLDLVELHREYCPWRNAKSQAASGSFEGLAAWEILWRVVASFADEVRRRSRDVSALSIVEAEGVNMIGTVEAEIEEPMEVSREETDRLDKERSSKLRRLKTVLGFKRKGPVVS